MSLRTTTMLVLLLAGLIPMLALLGATLPSVEGGLKQFVEAEAGARLDQAAADSRIRIDRLQIATLMIAQMLSDAGLSDLSDTAKSENSQSTLAGKIDQLITRWAPLTEGIVSVSVRDERGQELLRLTPDATTAGRRLQLAEVSANPLTNFRPDDSTQGSHLIVGAGEDSLLTAVSPILDSTGRARGEVALTVAADRALSRLSDLMVVLPDGSYLNRPAELRGAAGDSAFADFSELLGAGADVASIRSQGLGEDTLWVPLPLDPGVDSRLWLGSPLRVEGGDAWVQWYLKTAASIAAMLLFPVLLIAWMVARRSRIFHGEMLDRFDRVMIRDERVGFHWGGSREVRSFTASLTDLAERYIETESARKLEDRRLREEVVMLQNDLAGAQASCVEHRDRLARLPFGVLEVDTDGNIRYCNDTAVDLLGYESAPALGQHSLQDLLQHQPEGPGVRSTAMNALCECLNADRPSYVANAAMAHAHGQFTPVELHLEPLSRNGQGDGILVAFQDITLRQRAETIATREKDQLHRTLAAITDGVITADPEGRIQFMNATAEKMLGWPLAEARDRPLDEVYPITGDDDDETETEILPETVARDGIQSESAEGVKRRSGEIIFVRRDALPVLDGEGLNLGMVLVLRDITEDREREKVLRYQATHDPLTQLVNRYEFEKRVERTLATQAEFRGEYPLCFLDLDRFKVVNDSCGHAAGDELLRQLAKSLRSIVRQRDTFARVGGDEFAILLSQCPLHHALVLMERVLAAVKEFQFVWDDKTFEVGVSIGVVMLASELRDAATAIGVADRACYRAKQLGGNQVKVHKPNDPGERQRQEDAQWAARITKALRENRFKLFYQPIVPSERVPRNGESSQIEVFVRMIDNNGQMIPPDAFLPPAERHKLSRDVDRWVLGKVFEWSARAANQGASIPALVHVNVSCQTLSDNGITDYLSQLTAQTGVAAESICLEIKEAHAVLDPDTASDFVRYVRKLGFRVALGGCGKSHASPSFLKGLMVDYFKIHGELVHHVADDSVDLEIARAICQVAHALGRKVIAEWVENDAVLRAVRGIKVDYAQGNGIARPKPLDFLSETRER